MADERDALNRTRWLKHNLNGGVYIDDAEDRTNYLLDELERIGATRDECASNASLLATMLSNAIEGAEAAAESIGEPLFDDAEDWAVWNEAKDARDAFNAGALTELRQRWNAEDEAGEQMLAAGRAAPVPS